MTLKHYTFLFETIDDFRIEGVRRGRGNTCSFDFAPRLDKVRYRLFKMRPRGTMWELAHKGVNGLDFGERGAHGSEARKAGVFKKRDVFKLGDS